MSYLLWDSMSVQRGVSIIARSATIGRDPKNSVEIHHSRVSRCHARIEKSLDGDLLLDCSRNGTLINGVRVDSAFLLDGDVITFAGSVSATYRTKLNPEEIELVFDQRNQTFF